MKQMIVLFIFASSLLIGCSKDSGAPGKNPALDLKALNVNGCLNLQKLTETVDGNFGVPGRVTTVDFTASSGSNQVLVANFGSINRRMNSFPFIRKAEQADCSSATLYTSYGRKLNYKITESGTSFLRLVRDSSGDEQPTEKIHRTAANDEPEIRELRLDITSPFSAVLELNSELLLTGCGNVAKVPYQKTLSLRWGHQMPSSEILKASYVQRIQSLNGGNTPTDPVTPTVTPSPTPVEDPDNSGETPDVPPEEGFSMSIASLKLDETMQVPVSQIRDTQMRLHSAFTGALCR